MTVSLTTHSEWVLEALGNVVGGAGLPDRGPGQGGGEFLDANSVGAWLFKAAEPGRGSTVREIALDADTGSTVRVRQRRIGPAQRPGGDRRPARRRGVSGARRPAPERRRVRAAAARPAPDRAGIRDMISTMTRVTARWSLPGLAYEVLISVLNTPKTMLGVERAPQDSISCD